MFDKNILNKFKLDYFKIFNLLNEQIVIIDNNYNIVEVNDVFLKNMGFTKKNVIGKPCYAVSHNRTSPCLPPHDKCPLEIVMRTGKPTIVTHLHFTK